MPFIFELFPEKQMSHVQLEGLIEFEEFARRRTEYIERGVPKYELIEMQNSNLRGITADKLMEHSKQIRKNQPPPLLGSKTAVVACMQYQIGLFRMLENIVKSFGDDWPREVKFFETVEEAKDWLGLV